MKTQKLYFVLQTLCLVVVGLWATPSFGQCEGFDPLPDVLTLCNESQTTLDGPSGYASYSWYFEQVDGQELISNEEDLVVTQPGKYIISATDANGNVCIDFVEVNFKVVTLDPMGPFTACEGESVTLMGQSIDDTINPTYYWSDADGNIIQNGNGNLVVTASGTYTFTAVNFKNCDASIDIEVNLTPNPDFSLPNLEVCADETPVVITGPSGFSSYSWSNGEDTQSISTSSAGTYTLTVTDANGCSGSAAATVVVNDEPSISLQGAEVCADDAPVTIDGPSGFETYSWSNGASTEDITVSTSGTYTLTVTDANGCDASASATVVINAEPSISLEGAEVCDDSVTIDGPAGFASYSWSNGMMTEDITVSASGTYTLTVTDANGCDASASATVTINTSPSISLQDIEVCADNAPVTIDGPAGFASYSWSNGASTEDISVSTSGTYTLTVTDAEGCTTSASATVTINPEPTITMPDETLCDDGSGLMVSAPAGFASYSWSTGENTQTITINGAGTYSLTVVDANGCDASDSFTVTLVGGFELGPDPAVLCDEDSYLIDGPAGYDTYTWTDPSGNVVGTSEDYTATQTAFPTQTTKYTLQTTIGDCLFIDFVTVTFAGVELTDKPPVTICEGESFTFVGETFSSVQTGGNFWTLNGNIVQQGTTFTASGYGPGTYDFVYTVQDFKGCSDQTTCTLIVVGPPPVSVNNAELCADDLPATLTATPDGYASYTWSNGQNGQSISVSAAGTYTVTVTDENGCTNTATGTVVVNPEPTISLMDVEVCADNAPVTVMGPAGFATYSWSNGATTQNISVSTSGVYTLTVTDFNGCDAMDSATVTINEEPTISIDGATVCADELPVTISAPAGFSSYSWSTGSTSSTISVNAAGTYTVTVMDANGCDASASATVVVNAEPSISLQDIEICADNAPATIDGPSGFASYSWSNGATTEDISVSASGVYTLTVMDANGCDATASATVTINPEPSISLQDVEICADFAPATVFGPAGFASYMWSNGSTSQNIQVSASGVYTLTVMDANGCDATASATVTINEEPTISIDGDELCADDLPTTLTAPDGFASYTWSTGATTQSISVSAAGTYTVTVMDADGCDASASATVVVNPEPTISLQDVEICADDAPATVFGPSGFATYSWSNGATTQNISVSTSGVYTLTVTDFNGCDATASATVTINPEPSITIEGDELCADALPTTLTAPAGFVSYIWSNGSASQSISVNAAGTYTVTVIDANGCDASASATVVVNPEPTISLQDVELCADFAPATIDGPSGFATYSWSNGATTEDISVSASGVYTLTVTDANGCDATASATVTINPEPSISLQDVEICADFAPATVFGPAGFASYSWSNGSTSQNIQVSTSGVYTLTVVDFNGCDATASATVTINDEPSISIDGAELCADDLPATLTAPSGFASYTWSTGATTQSISVNAAGTYTVTVMDANGCDASASAQVIVNPEPQISLQDVEICADNAPATVFGPSGFATYSWSNGATTQNISVSTSGVYTLTVTDANGCDATASATVTINPEPSISIDGAEVCADALPVTLSAPAGFVSYVWSNGSTSSTISVNAAGTYTVTVIDANGCDASASAEVIVNPEPSISLQGAELCADDLPATLTAPDGFASYTWSNGATTQSISVSAAGTYTVTVVDANGCDASASAQVIVNPEPTISLQDVEICADNAPATVFGPAGFATYSWSNGATTQNISVSTSGVYTLTVTDFNGCDATASATVTINPEPSISIDGAELCADDLPATLTAPSGFVSYVWSTGSSSQTISVNAAGTYTVTVIDANGCDASASATVIVNPEPQISLQDVEICADFAPATIDGPSGFTTYSWSNGATTEDISVSTSGVYTLTVTDANGCDATASATVTINPEPSISLQDVEICADFAPATLFGPAGFASYAWSNGSTSQNIQVSASGVYTLTVVDFNGCDASASATVTINPEPSISLEGAEVCADDLPVTLTAPSGFASYAWNTGASTQSITATTAGTYSVTVIDENGCDASASAQVIVNPEPTISLQDVEICADFAPATVFGPAGFASYSWSNGATTQNISVSTSGVYTLTVVDFNGCDATASATVTINPEPSISLEGAEVCADDLPVTLTAPAGFVSYVWSNGNASQSISVNAAGTYTVTVIDANGCDASASATVIVNPEPQISLANIEICADDAPATIDGPSGFATYSWSNGATTEDISVSASGVYTLTVTDANGCDATASATVTINPEPSISLQDVEICADFAPATVFGPAGFASYSWSNGSTTQNIQVSASGVYTLTVVDFNGCDATASATVTINPEPSISLQDIEVCADDAPVTIDGPSGFATYTWSTGATTEDISVSTSGVYTLTVTDANGCDASATATVTINPEPTIALQDVEICADDAPATVFGPAGFASYSWSNGATTQNISVSTSGVYTLTVVDFNGCDASASATVTINPEPSISLEGAEVCADDLPVTLTAPAGFVSYIWSTGSSSQSIVVNAAGTYSVTVIDANGCDASASATVIVNPEPQISLQDVEICADFAPATIDGPSGFATYSWSNGATTEDISVSASGVYTLTVTDANGCDATASATVTINPEPQISLQDVEICADFAPATVFGPAGFASYSWSNGSTSQNIQVFESGVYTLTVVDFNGCDASASATVTINPEPSISLEGAEVCADELPVTLTAPSGFASYTWNTGASTQSITVTAGGTYSVTVIDENGCDASASAQVIVNPEPTISLQDVEICADFAPATVFGPAGFASYSWSNGASTQNISVTESGVYTLTVVDFNGCDATASATVTINPEPSISLEGAEVCADDLPVTLTAPAGFVSYIWSNGNSSQSIVVNAAGTYSVTVFDANGCDASASATVIVNPEPQISLQDVEICADFAPATIDGPSGFATYSWSNGATTEDISVSASGVYTLTVTDANGCDATASATVTINPEPQISLQDVEICADFAPATVFGPAGFASYAWSTGATTQNISVTESGVYTLTVVDFNGCDASASATVTINPEPSISLEGAEVCADELPVTLTAPAGFASYTWSTGATTSSITVTTAGTYSVTVIDENGCDASASAQVIVNPEPTIALQDVEICADFAPATVFGPAGFASYSWSNGASTQNISVTESGVYTLTVVDFNGCDATASATVTINPEPSISLEGAEVCADDLPVTLTAPAGFVSYVWSNGNSSQSIVVNAAGTYSVTVFDANGCDASASATVIVNPEPQISLQDVEICADFAPATIDGPSGFATYSWSNGATTEDISVSASGVYTLTVTDANGCDATASATVTINPEPSISLQDVEICADFAPATVFGPAGFASYAWSTGATTQNISVTESGVYTLTVVDFNGCDASASATVTINPEPSISIEGAEVCADELPVTLTAPAGFASYTWSTGATTSSITVTTAGTYSVTVIDENGCDASASAQVIVNPEPTIALQDVEICADFAPATVFGPAGFASYSWSNGASTQNISVTESGVYTLTVVDFNGCDATASATVTINPEPSISIDGAEVCADALPVTLTAPAGFVSYVWSNGNASQSISVNAAGTYTVTVIDANGCDASASATVIVNPEPQISLQDVEICADFAPATIDGPSGFATYSWSNGATTEDISVSASGVYTLTVTDANGCDATASATVTINPEPSISLQDVEICADFAPATVFGPAGFASYAWSTGATTQNISVTESGVYTLTVVDFNGCDASASATVTINPEPSISIDGAELCADELPATLTAPAGFASYTWSTGATTSSITVTAAGTYSVTVIDENGCDASASAQVIVNPEPTIALQDVEICADFAPATVQGPAGFATYSWSNGASTQNITVIESGVYTLTVTDANGCDATASATVTINPEPSISIDGAEVCADALPVTLTAPAGFTTYVWSNGSTSSSISVNAAGTYTVTVTDANGCDASASAQVIVNPEPTIALQDVEICADSAPATIDGPSGYATYSWSNGATTEDITVSASGVYTLTVTDANGCDATASATVTINPEPSISLEDVEICADFAPATLMGPAGFTTYSWSNGMNTQNIMVTTSGVYTLTVTDANGCDATASATVTINPEPSISLEDITVCDDQAPVTLFGPAGFASYTWSNGSTAQNITVDASGVYTLTVVDANGCDASASATVTINTSPSISLPDFEVCADDAPVTVQGPAGFASYSWSNGASSQSISVSTSGVYTLTVTDANGCTATAVSVVTINPEPSISLEDVVICANDLPAIVEGPAGFATYTWSTGATTQNIQVNAGGVYTLTVTDGNGCDATASATVMVNDEPTLILDDITVCEDDLPVMVSAPAGFSSYEWSNGETGQSFMTSTEGVYFLTVTDANGCQATYAATVSILQNPVIDLEDIDVCADELPVIIDGPVGFASYAWSTGATSQDIQVTTSGVYTLTVTDFKGCTATASATVSVNTVTPFDLTDITVCEDDAPVTVTGPDGYTSYVWSNGAVGQSITTTVSGAIELTVTDANGCTYTDEIVVAINQNPIFDLNDVDACAEDLPATIYGPGPAGFYTYEWSNGATTQDLVVTAPGVYTLTVTDANGCQSTESSTVTVGGDVSFDLDDVTVCEGSAVTLAGPAGFSTYTWSTGATTQNITVSASGTYTLTVSNGDGCSATESATVTFNAAPAISLEDAELCAEDAPTTLTAPAGYASYAWSNGANTQSITVSTSGVYSVTVTDANGCVASASASVTINAAPAINLSDISVCEGETATLSAPGGFASYLWSTGETSQSITVSGSGTYTVTVTDANGCSASDSANVSVGGSISVSLEGAMICEGESTVLTAPAGFSSYTWNTGATSQSITVSAAGTYTVTVVSADGCSGSASAEVMVNPNPNATVNSEVVCDEDLPVTLTAEGGSSYVWSTGETTQSITVSTFGTYTVTVTDANGCTDTASGNVTEGEECTEPTAGYGDTVFFDEDGDGVQDAGEPGISGVTVTLTYPDGSTVTTTTDENGNYFFGGLEPGTYTATVDATDSEVADLDITTAGSFTVTLADGDVYVDGDFGFEPVEEITGTIGDTVWYDTDGDGVQDAGEQGIAGVTVKLLDENGNEIATTETDANGNYLFTDLPLGTYDVMVDNTDSEVADLESTTTIMYTDVTLTESNPTDLDNDFGFVAPAECNLDVEVTALCAIDQMTFDLIVTFGGVDNGNGFIVTESVSGQTEEVSADGSTAVFSGLDADGGYNVTVSVIGVNGCNETIGSTAPQCQGVTAIELVEFDGRKVDTDNFLFWSTAQEIDVDYFVLERSANGVDFEAVANINAAGNSSTTQSYDYTDANVGTGTLYYRLAEVTTQGDYNVVSDVVALSREASFGIDNVYPTNATDIVTIDITSNFATDVTVEVFGADGRVMDIVNINVEGTVPHTIDVSGYTAGMYFIRINNGVNAETAQFIKQ